LRFIEHDRERKPSTLKDYRSALHSRLIPAFGDVAIDDVTPEAVVAWRASLELRTLDMSTTGTVE
jgi:hypothetical protein